MARTVGAVNGLLHLPIMVMTPARGVIQKAVAGNVI